MEITKNQELQPLASLSKTAFNNKPLPETTERSMSKHDQEPDPEIAVETNIDKSKLEEVAQGINDYLKNIKTSLQVEIDEKTNRAIFKVVRTDDDTVIREIPPREMLELEAKIRDMIGSLVDQTA